MERSGDFRWKADPTEDRWGTFIFLRDTTNGQWWSATAEPRVIEGEKTKTIFTDDKAEFHKNVGDLQSVVECIVATEHDADGRRVTLLNVGSEDRYIEVTSYMEPVIASEDDDNAHPLFSRMFVQTEIGRRGDVIRARRNRRSPNEPGTIIAHLAADNAGPSRPTEFETDRASSSAAADRSVKRLHSIRVPRFPTPTASRSIQSCRCAALCAYRPARR